VTVAILPVRANLLRSILSKAFKHHGFLHLATEALHETDVTTRSFPIDICVRRVTSESRRECVIAIHQELYDSIFSKTARSYSEEQ
jgi:hypothetical protein